MQAQEQAGAQKLAPESAQAPETAQAPEAAQAAQVPETTPAPEAAQVPETTPAAAPEATPAPASPEEAAPEVSEAPKSPQREPAFHTPVLFTLEFPIRLEDFLEFHSVLSAAALKRQRTRGLVLGGFELVISLGYLALCQAGVFAPMGGMQWLCVSVLIALGLYSFLANGVFHPYFTRRALVSQYNKSGLEKMRLVMEFHEDGIEETTGGRRIVTRFGEMYGITATKNLFMVRMDARRCVLIPRSTLGELDAQLDALLTRAAATYGKERSDL